MKQAWQEGHGLPRDTVHTSPATAQQHEGRTLRSEHAARTSRRRGSLFVVIATAAAGVLVAVGIVFAAGRSSGGGPDLTSPVMAVPTTAPRTAEPRPSANEPPPAAQSPAVTGTPPAATPSAEYMASDPVFGGQFYCGGRYVSGSGHSGNYSDCESVIDFNGTIEVFVIGTDHAVWTIWNGGGGWSRWVSLDGKGYSFVWFTHRNGPAFTINMIGTDGATWHKDRRSDGTWSGWSR